MGSKGGVFEYDARTDGVIAVGREIERKFLVTGDGWRPGEAPKPMRQGYVAFGPPASVRVRISGQTAHLNIKQSTLAIARDEFEYEIPVDDAEFMLANLCAGPLVEKTRYHVRHGGLLWEVDVFEGANAGLVLAEIELDSLDQHVSPPAWVGMEVSGDARYLNSSLAQRPFTRW
jgi:adenylate cyclase